MPDPIRVLGVAGSLRKASLNRALLRAAIEAAPPTLTIEAFDLGLVPLYNGDVEAQGDPEGVAAFKQAIAAADAVLFVTPEYNHGVPGVMKNAVDWASRPPRGAPLGGKSVGIIGASPGMTGSARGQSQLRQAFEFTDSYCMPQPELLVFKAHEKFDEAGALTDEPTRTYLGRYLSAFEGLGAAVQGLIKTSFAAVADARTRLLVLGSLPGERSLAAAQYYAHPRNQFWRLIGEVIGADLTRADYPRRLERLLEAGVGLWDVIGSAERQGSLDAAIRRPTANPLADFLATLPKLRAVAFNGGKAAQSGTRLVAQRAGYALVSLPSSSPAHTLPFEAKLARWRPLRAYLQD